MCFKPRNKIFAHETSPALHPTARFRQRGVIGHKPRMRHAIAIREDQIIAGGAGHGLVENDGLAEPRMRLPEVLERGRRGRRELLHQRARGFPRSVVGDEHLVRPAGLPREAAPRLGQRFRLVKSADDDDFMDDYRGGRYDVVCEECGGQNVIEMVDEENCLPELLEIYFEEMQELQDYENERRMQY